MDLEELYQHILLDHARNSAFKGALSAPARSLQLRNPLCGDEVTFYLLTSVSGDGKSDGENAPEVISEARYSGHGCMISQAAASILAKALVGKSTERAIQIMEEFRAVMKSQATYEGSNTADDDIRALEGVKKFPIRIKCALLPFDAAERLLRNTP